MATRAGRAWGGWVAFAATMLLLVGMINIFQGFVALVWDDRLVVTADNFVLVDLTSWGWTLLLSGVVLLAVGAGLYAAQTWARITAIVVIILHVLSQVAWLGAYPLWSLLMIGLDTVVLFALTARWSEARDNLSVYGDGDGPPADRRSEQQTAYEARGYQHKVT